MSINLAPVLSHFPRETVDLYVSERVADPLEPSGFATSRTFVGSLEATIIQSDDVTVAAKEKSLYGQVATHFYFPGSVDLLLGDFILRQSNSTFYKVQKDANRKQGNYTRVVATYHERVGDRVV